MKPAEKLAVMDRLLDELTRYTKKYNECLKKDDVFEVKKKIRMRLKEIHEQIAALNQPDLQTLQLEDQVRQ